MLTYSILICPPKYYCKAKMPLTENSHFERFVVEKREYPSASHAFQSKGESFPPPAQLHTIRFRWTFAFIIFGTHDFRLRHV